MGFINFLEKLGNRNKINVKEVALDFTYKSMDSGYLDYAIMLCVSKIANALSQCQIDTYKDGKREKGLYWYKFNIEPNLNMNTTQFWHSIVYKMITSQEGALIVQDDKGNFVVADSFLVQEFAFKENVYKEIKIGNLELNRIYHSKDVLHLKFNRNCMETIIQRVYKKFEDLIEGSIQQYKRKNAKKIIVKIDAMFNQFQNEYTQDGKSTKYNDIMDSLFKDRLKKIFDDSDCAIPLEEGLTLMENGEENGAAKKSEEATRDIRLLLNDILNIVADALNVPRALLKGDVADIEAVTDNFITFCVNSYANILEDEINRKLYGKERVLKGSKLRIRTGTIKSYDLTKLAASAEALFRIGVYNANDVRRLLREEEIQEDWANTYSITKNYEFTNQKNEEDE